MTDIKEMMQMQKRHFEMETEDFMVHIGNVKPTQTVQ